MSLKVPQLTGNFQVYIIKIKAWVLPESRTPIDPVQYPRSRIKKSCPTTTVSWDFLPTWTVASFIFTAHPDF